MRAWQRARELREITARIPVRAGSVWSTRLKRFFELAVLRWHRVGKHVPSDAGIGRPRRNEWIAQDLFYLSGEKKTAKQVASQLQMRRHWVKDNGITWEEHILSKYAFVSDSGLSDCGAEIDDDDETPPSLIDDSG